MHYLILPKIDDRSSRQIALDLMYRLEVHGGVGFNQEGRLLFEDIFTGLIEDLRSVDDSRVEDLQNEVDDLEKQVESLEKDLSEKEDTISDLTHDLDEIQYENQELTRELELLQAAEKPTTPLVFQK